MYGGNAIGGHSPVLAKYEYKIEPSGERVPLQTFLCDQPACSEPYSMVTLEVLTNYGDKSATCVYQLKVFGTDAGVATSP
jgi:hypothetical protein